jgi:ABC-type Mn2+/Zn2+ transport system ATPase subunit
MSIRTPRPLSASSTAPGYVPEPALLDATAVTSTDAGLTNHCALRRVRCNSLLTPVRLDLVVGPNGDGKSTFVEIVLAPRRPFSGWAFDDAAPPG